MNLIETLTNQFQSLLSDQKKNQTLKPMIITIIDELKKIKPPNHNVPLEEILKILVRLPENKSNQTSTIALNIMSKLFNTNTIKENDYHSILHSLYLFKDDQIENVQLKLVQCSINLINLQIVNINNPECIEKLVCIFFTLVISRNPIIQNTSMTGLQQIIELLFQQYQQNPNKNAINILNQLIEGLYGKSKVQYIIQHQYSKGICRDLVFHLVKYLNSFINQDESLTKIVQEKLTSLIYEEMNLDIGDIQFNARRIRDCFRIIEYLQNDIQLIKHITLLYQRTNNLGYIRYWILEGILDILQMPNLVLKLHQSSEEQQSTYLQHLIFLIKSATEQEQNNQISNIKQSKYYETNIICMTEQPIYSKTQFILKSIECISHFTDTLQQIAYEKNIKLCIKHYQINQNKCVVDEICSDLNQIIESGWQLILKSIQNLFYSCNDERQSQSLLNSIQTWINFTGTLGQTRARDQFIKFLATLSVGKGQLTNNQIQSSKMLFNIAQLGAILDVKSWHLIMKTMQQFDVQLQKSQNNPENTELYNQELILLNNILEGMFLSSDTFEDQNLLNMIDSINQVTLGVMETCSTTTQQLDPKIIQFGLQRIFQISKVNWFRIENFWDFITTHFICIVNCKQKQFREYALDIFSQLIQQGFQYFLKREDSEQREQWQQQILNPIYQMVKIQYFDVKETLLNIIFKLIQNNGHELNKAGFNSIIEILSVCCDDTEPAYYVNVGFHILELMIGQFLHLLDPETTKRLLPLIKQFRQKTTEQNISFVSVGLIWQLADNLTKVCGQGTSQEELEELWTAVLLSLKDLCLDLAPDVRQSALHIIIQIILINCASFRVQFQINLLKTLIFKVLDDLIGRVAQLQQLQVIFHVKMPKYLTEEQYPKFTRFSEQELIQDPKLIQDVTLWEETLKLMVQNLTKILKKLGSQEDELLKNNVQDLYNQAFIRLIFAFKINNLDLRWEIIKLIKENTELIIERKLLTSVDWSKDFLTIVQEFLNQKLQDNRDVKTLVNKILPEICELYVLFFKTYYRGTKFYDGFINDILSSYQEIVDNPIKLENISNIKIWMDEKQLHDYAEDFYQQITSPQDQIFLLKFMLFNINKEGSINKLQDIVILKYSQLFCQFCTDNVELKTEFIQSCLKLIQNRLNANTLNSIKTYNKTNKPIYVSIFPYLIQIAEQPEYKLIIPQIGDSLQNSQMWDKISNIDGLKSCIDLELQICEWLLKMDQIDYTISYWNLLNRNINLYQFEELVYETRQKFMQLIIKKQNGFAALLQLAKQLVQQFMRDEYMSGSMPLSRKRVQEIIFLLLELQQLKDVQSTPHPLIEVFECLVELITTREIDIKQPLQNLFREISLKIKQ